MTAKATKSGKRALIIGGGGPTGPLIVNGLLERGYEVSVLNTGRHPVQYDAEVERIVADPHFAEPLETVLQGRRFDVALAQYGRLRLVAEALAGRADHLIAVGGMFYPGWIDPAATVRPASETGETRDWTVTYLDEARPMPENTPLDPVGKFGQRVVEAAESVLQGHQRGDFVATLLRYPRVYGPRQPGAAEWSILRRILDGRRRILVPEGGFLIQSVLYVVNAARVVLSLIDNPELSAGEVFNCADPEPITHRKWIKAIASIAGAEIELVSAPMSLALPSWPYARFPLTTGHHILDTAKQSRLAVEMVPFEPAIRHTVEWYLEDPAGRGRPVEPQLNDPFDYEAENALFAELDASRERIDAINMPMLDMAHTYSHPTKKATDGPK
jgi:nucleoside-diphosphate-sugar epimerase